MEYGMRVSDYGVQHGATINVNLRNYEVMVFIKTLTGRTIMVRVTPSDTVSMVKAKIEQQEGMVITKLENSEVHCICAHSLTCKCLIVLHN